MGRMGPALAPDDLREHTLMTYRYRESPNEWRFFAPHGGSISVPVVGSIQMNNSLALRETLLQGVGITLTPTFVVGPDIRTGKLQRVLSNYHAPELSIDIIYPQRWHLSPKVRAFVDFMAEQISDAPYWERMDA